MMDYGKSYQQAEALRKGEQLQEAEAEFRALWAERPNPNVGWRWTYCLRKLGRSQEALQAATQVVKLFPDDEWVRREYAWCIYQQEVKPAQIKGDVGRVVHFSQRMLELAQDDLIRRQAVFTVVDVAKERAKWDIVSQWCDRLDRQRLSAEQNMFGERKSMSDRERWYYAKVKALVNLKQWAEARNLAMEAAALFPQKDDFPRWAAQARANEGDMIGAAEEVANMVRRGTTQWYILADLAQMKLRLGQNEEALQVACKAALAFGEDKAKVNLFALLAEIGLALNLGEFAAYHAALTKALRLREGWSVKEDLLRLEQRVNAAFAGNTHAEISTDPGQLLILCQREWRKWISEGKTRYTGKVCNLPEGKKFGFIAPDSGGENIHVPLRDLPRAAQVVGARVEYSLEPSFDHKKNRESLRAVDVRVASSSKAGNSDR